MGGDFITRRSSASRRWSSDGSLRGRIPMAKSSRPKRRAGPPYHISFLGRLHPFGHSLTVNSLPAIQYHSDPLKYDVTVSPTVVASRVRINMELSAFSDDIFVDAYIRGTDVAKAVIDLCSFERGWGMSLTIDQWITPDGTKRDLRFNDPNLIGLCTAYVEGGDIAPLLKDIIEEPAIMLALNDLILSNNMPHSAPINCARAIEGIRQIIAGPGTEAKKAWPVMQAALNLDQSFILPITDNSKDHRHGNRTTIEAPVLRILTTRSWIIMNRFFHLRLRKLQQLPLSEFPILTG